MLNLYFFFSLTFLAIKHTTHLEQVKPSLLSFLRSSITKSNQYLPQTLTIYVHSLQIKLLLFPFNLWFFLKMSNKIYYDYYQFICYIYHFNCANCAIHFPNKLFCGRMTKSKLMIASKLKDQFESFKNITTTKKKKFFT